MPNNRTRALAVVAFSLSAAVASAEVPRDSSPLSGEWLDRKVHLTFLEADLAKVLQSVGKIGGVEFVVAPELHYRVSFDIADTPVRRVLDLIAETQSLAYEQEGGVVHVRKRTPSVAE